MFTAIAGALNGKPTVLVGNPLLSPQEAVELAERLIEEWAVVGVSVSVRGDTAYFEPTSDGDDTST